MSDRPIIGITMGDPVGIGPEILLAALSEPTLFDICKPLVLGDVGLLSKLNLAGATPLDVRPVESPEAGIYQQGIVDVISLSDLSLDGLEPGRPNKKTGSAMVRYITAAIDLALAGTIQGVATGPINKAAMQMAGFHYQGHTELFAERTRTSRYVMMLAGSRLRVALVTIHVPLSAVVKHLSAEKILETLRITHSSLTKAFGIGAPRLAVAALNPHGGEGGLFGNEEADHILPALKKAATEGIDVGGPYPADTLFYRALEGNWDAIICMYHDQGLIPFKMLHFTDGVNTTLGLPIVRTSVDHGTAYDIAGSGTADAGSLIAAIDLAARQARRWIP